jgi:hypothetical protein
VIDRGKLAVVIGVESSDPFGCSEHLGVPACDRAGIEAAIRRLHRLGVCSMFIAHWVDNALAGAALEGGDKGAFIGTMQEQQTGAPFATGDCPHPGQGEKLPPLRGRRCNTRGLTDLGRYAVARLMAHHMLIEVDHLSEVARDQVLSIARRHDYPLVSSHTNTGGTWSRSQLRRLLRTGGFASVTLDDPATMPRRVRALRADGAGTGAVGLGTDTGGFKELPGPGAFAGRPPLGYPFRSFDGRVRFERQRTGSRAFDLNVDGVAHYGLVPDALAEIAREPGGRRALRELFRSAGGYLRTWRRTGAG